VFCPACGTKAAVGDRFCHHCGKPLPTDVAQPTSSAWTTESPPPVPQYGAPTPPAAPHGWYPPAPPAGPNPPPVYGAYPPYGAYRGQAAAWPGYATGPTVPLAPFGAPLARWWQRVGSMLLDGVIVGIPIGVLSVVFTTVFGTSHVVKTSIGSVTSRALPGGGEAAMWIAFLALQGIYFAVLNGTGSGQTLGNRAPRIAVRDMNTGAAIGPRRGIVRWLIRAVLYVALVVPGLLNDLWPLWDGRRQSIADKVAHSVVIRLD